MKKNYLTSWRLPILNTGFHLSGSEIWQLRHEKKVESETVWTCRPWWMWVEKSYTKLYLNNYIVFVQVYNLIPALSPNMSVISCGTSSGWYTSAAGRLSVNGAPSHMGALGLMFNSVIISSSKIITHFCGITLWLIASFIMPLLDWICGWITT